MLPRHLAGNELEAWGARGRVVFAWLRRRLRRGPLTKRHGRLSSRQWQTSRPASASPCACGRRRRKSVACGCVVTTPFQHWEKSAHSLLTAVTAPSRDLKLVHVAPCRTPGPRPRQMLLNSHMSTPAHTKPCPKKTNTKRLSLHRTGARRGGMRPRNSTSCGW